MTDSRPEADSTSRRIRRVTVIRHDGENAEQSGDAVALEEPLEIRLGDQPLAVTMRTPGDDQELARGFLLTEGILLSPDEAESFDTLDESRISVRLRADVHVDVRRFQRNMFVSSSCGVCGKAALEMVGVVARPRRPFQLQTRVAAQLAERLRQHQPTFDTTGGLHAAGLFGLDGTALAVREDVGRHNAVDKVIGAVSAQQWPLPISVLVVSGRQSFEIVQKAAVVGIGAVVGISAPSSLAVALAERLDMLLIGFARGSGFNVYSGKHHLTTRV